MFLSILSKSFHPITLIHSKTNCNSDRVDYTKKRYPVFMYKSEQKLIKQKERKKLASSILLLRKRSNHYHSIFAVFHAERNNILCQVQKWALSANSATHSF